MLDLVKEFLNKQKWQYSQVQANGVLLFGIAGRNGSFQCIADVMEMEKKFVFISICGTNAPQDKRNDVLNLLNRLNYEFFFGDFEMSPDSGEIRFKTNLPFHFITPNSELINQLISNNIITMDKCLPGIMRVMFGEIAPQKAVELITKQEIADIIKKAS